MEPEASPKIDVNAARDTNIEGDVVGRDKESIRASVNGDLGSLVQIGRAANVIIGPSAIGSITAQLIVSICVQLPLYLLLGGISFFSRPPQIEATFCLATLVIIAPITFGIHALYNLIRGRQANSRTIIYLGLAAGISSCAPLPLLYVAALSIQRFALQTVQEMLTRTPVP